MKNLLRSSIDRALARLREAGELPADAVPDYQIETPKHAAHGDYSTNVAMLLAKPCRRKPRDIAAQVAEALAADGLFERIDIAGPGFINFVVDNEPLFAVVDEVLDAGAAYGRSTAGAGRRVQVEFVSANPTGPLHVGHGRGAAIGSVLARLLEATGHEVVREYYVNDAGRQMDILALSVFLRYLQACAVEVPYPAAAYQGDYIRDIASELHAEHGEGWRVGCAPELARLDDEDAERQLDGAIGVVREALGAERFDCVREHARERILRGIETDLRAFGVEFDVWFSEAALIGRGLIDAALGVLEQAGHLYQQDGARWFRSAALGDEKDRVVVRENGQTTYFASDIAYHHDKLERGFDAVVDVWGADHHGYVPRVRAAMAALGADPSRLDVVLVQFAALVRGGEKVSMSTRAGEFVTLRELVDEVGADAARFFYLMRRADQHLEFDLDLAKSESSDNPVYYVQYAHARVASVFRQLAERELAAPAPGSALAGVLAADAERRLAMLLARYPETLAAAAEAREPHTLVQYLRDLAHEFHGYYNAHKVLVDDPALRAARLRLIDAVRQVIANGLELLAVSAPQQM